LGGRPVEVRSTTAPGCLIELPDKAPAAAPRAVTYHNRISRILQNHCQECHRPGETAPFELMTYADAKAHLKTIGREVQRGAMPPWFANAAHGGPWVNDRSLSEADKADLLAWVRAGGPEGDPKDAPLPRTWQSGWQIGKPDAVFQPARTFKVKAQGTMPYQHIWVPTNLEEDKYIQSIEVRPSSPQHVHHVLVFLVYPRTHPRAAEQPDYRGGLRGYFAGMVPGQWATFFPKGTAKFLPKGGILLFQIHYTPNGTAAEDRPSVGVVFAKDKPQFELETKSAANSRFVIPPMAPSHEVVANATFRVPTRIFSLMPHSHVRGKAFRYELISRGGEAKTILDVPRYDFNWQFEYRLAEPIDVPAGSKLKVTGWYDNSKDNPANPDPTKAARFGEQTSDEMMIGYYTGHPLVRTPPAPPATRPAR
jgi:mono/diheme cytochrome c family protein